MIVNFKCRETEKIFHGKFSAKLPQNIQRRACTKLVMLNAATSENDLLVPYSNNFEHLIGDLKDYCSIRVNDQYRIVFKFNNNNVYDVYLTDYH